MLYCSRVLPLCDGACAETSFHLLAKQTNPYTVEGGGWGLFSQVLAVKVCALACILYAIARDASSTFL
jgi:hypothetical protein